MRSPIMASHFAIIWLVRSWHKENKQRNKLKCVLTDDLGKLYSKHDLKCVKFIFIITSTEISSCKSLKSWFHLSNSLTLFIIVWVEAGKKTKRQTGLENRMENGTENRLVEDLTVICLSK